MMWNNNTYYEKIKEINIVAGKEKIDKIHANGKMTARERMEALFDNGDFTEIDMFAQSRVDLGEVKKKHYIGDGVITGFGMVNGVVTYAAAQDSMVSGGAGGETHINKINRTLELAIKTKSPMIFLCDSGGARIEEGIISLAAYSRLFYLNTKASGLIPQIAAIMGNCAGGSSYSPAMCDFVFMVKNTSQFFITGPKVIKALTGEEVSMNDLGGYEMHSQYSGQAHFVSESDSECIENIRKLLDYIVVQKKNNFEQGKVDFLKRGRMIENIIPTNTRKSYDVRDVINNLIDTGSFYESQKDFAKNIVTGFARLNGRTIGIVANQPQVIGGALDCDSSDKCARFVRFCDCFNISILVLEDVPGFYPGLQQEKMGMLRHGCKILYAFAEATVPKITVIMRKAYGGAYCAMNSKNLGADYVLAWPICEVAVMGADGAVDIILHRQIESAENPQREREEQIKKYEEKYLNPYFAASYGMVDEVILPENTRTVLIKAFEGLENKSEEKVLKKHGNIAL